MTKKMTAQEIIDFIGNSKKQTPVKAYIKGDLSNLSFPDSIRAFVETKSGVIFGDWADVKEWLAENQSQVEDVEIENDARNSAVPLLDIKEIYARIEPGAVIRDQVTIGKHAVIMMGAIINIGAEIGEETMIDMGVVLGGRAIVGKRSHIGAGAVLAGVVEPPSATPVTIGNDVVIGANAVVIEGVQVGDGAVVAAGAIVTKDVAPHTMVAGVPARKIKDIDQQTESKTQLLDELRKM